MEESEFHLTEIRRQALDSPIIRLSIDIRQGKFIKFGKYGKGVFKIDGEQLSNELLLKSDQLLCGKNNTRRFLNKKIRKLKGYDNRAMPSIGEKIIGLNNLPMNGLFNGQMWLSNSDYSDTKLQYSHKSVMNLRSREDIDGEPLSKVIIPAWFPDDLKGKSFKNQMQLSAFLQENSIYSVDFGYAITIHKCIPMDTLVRSDKGLVEIGSLDNGAKKGEFKKFDSPIMLHNGVELEEVKAFYNNGVDDLFKITSKRGYELSTTSKHTMLIFDTLDGKLKEKETHTLNIETDNLLLAANSKCFNTKKVSLKFSINEQVDVREIEYLFPRFMNTDLGLLLGLLTADGFIDDRRIHYTKGSLELCNIVKGLFVKLFNYPEDRISIKKSPKADFYIVAIHSMSVARFLNNFSGLKANNKHVDSLILSSSKPVQAAFLQGLFEDGYVNIKNGKFDHIELTMKEDKLFTQVQLMLLNFGIVTSKYIKYGKKYTKGYINAIFIYSYHAQTFYKEIGFIDAVKNDKLHLSFNTVNKYGKQGFAISALIERLFDKYNLSRKLKDGTTYVYKTRNLTLNIISRIIHNYSSIEGIQEDEDFILLTYLVSHNFYLEPIKEITQVEAQHTVCVKMKQTPLFIQNGIVAGNSQGDSFKRPMIFEEFLGNKKFHTKWLYTAVTRAEEKLILVSE